VRAFILATSLLVALMGETFAQDSPSIASLYSARNVDANCREFSGAIIENAKQMACGSFENDEGRRQWRELMTTIQADGWQRYLQPGQVIGPPIYARYLAGEECLELLYMSYDWEAETYRVTTWGFVVVDALNCSDQAPLMIVRPARSQ
jgi:hypothetical protein